MSSVTFPVGLGGDGSTVTDDNNPTTGLGNGGHRTRFVPALSQVVAMADTAVDAASTATTQASNSSNSASVSANYATKTDAYVTGTDNSAKSWALGGTGTGSPAAGSAKDWATKLSTPVDGVEYSAKYYANLAASLYDQFDDKYLGNKASDPTLDNDGNPLVAGAQYFNTTFGEIRVYTGSVFTSGITSIAGVSSFKGRVGAVIPVAGDYTESMITGLDAKLFFMSGC